MVSLLALLPERPAAPLTIGISECLAGGQARYDGGHKRSSMPHDELDGLFEYRPVCPEVGIGLGVPREPIRLVGSPAAPRAGGIKDARIDVTDRLGTFAEATIDRIGDIDGYIFTKNSPSCGLFRVKVYGDEGAPPIAAGRGIFAAEITRRRPGLPVEENGRLQDPALRENFVTRTFVHAHWRALVSADLSAESLIAFHSAYKYLVMAHDVAHYRDLGRLLSDLAVGFERKADAYFEILMQALTKPATRGGHANALSHLQGYVKKDLSGAARAELAGLIESYRCGEVPLLAPMTLLKHYLGTHQATYAWEQLYLDPHPANAGLRRDL